MEPTRAGPFGLLIVAALSGCVGDAVQLAAPIPEIDSTLWHHGPPSHLAALDIRIARTGAVGSEPTLGVDKEGRIFVAGSDVRVLRSADDGASWKDVSDPLRRPPANLDPWLWLDPRTDRVFQLQLDGVCSWIAWTDDAGTTWEVNPLGGCGAPVHHYEKLSSGPPPGGVATAGYPSVLYYSSSSLRNPDPQHPDYLIVAGTGTWISRSLDGGRTWNLGAEVHPATPGCPDSQGSPVAVAPDGTAYSAQNNCGSVRFSRSSDAGSSWKVASIVWDVGYQSFGSEPAVEVDADGTVYLAYAAQDGIPVLRTSRDQGTTWTAPVRVAPPGVNATMFTVLSVGAPGRAAFAYLGTDSDPATWPRGADTSYAPDSTVWHLYVTVTQDGLNPDPSFVTRRATPADDPVQRGCIWLRGGVNACRNLADFIDITHRGGRPYVVYTDGCERCASAGQSRGRVLDVAIVEGGPSLLDADLGRLSPSPPTRS